MKGFTTVAVAGLLVAVSACGIGGDDSGSDGVVVPEVYDLDHDPAADVPAIDPERADVLPAVALRATLEDLLGWHGITLVQAMQATVRGDDETVAWVDELVGNTDAITGAVGIVYGPTGARAFHQQWAQHTQFLVDYADAVRRGSKSDRATARDNLRSYARDNASLLSTALGGALPADAIEDLLDQHVENMIEQVERYHDGDEFEALTVALDDNSYLLSIADALAAGFAGQQPEVFPGDTETPQALLCTIVNRSSGDLALAALAKPSIGTRGDGTLQTATADLDQALTDLESDGVGSRLPQIESQSLLDAIAEATANSDENAAVAATLAWREFVSQHAGLG